MSTDPRARQPKGIPVGGQFAATSHAESDLTLDATPQDRLTRMAPADIDTELAALHADLYRAQDARDRNWESMRGQVRSILGRRFGQTATDADITAAIEQTEARPESERIYTDNQLLRTAAAHDAAVNRVEEISDAIEPYEAEFIRRGGWSRAFLVVTNGTGHVHRGMDCSTCYPTTRYHWVTEMSDHDEGEIVDAAGERACTVCYPSAPSEVRDKPTRLFTPDEVEAAKAREERAAAKTQREAEKVAKALTADGSEAVFRYVWATRGDGTELTTTERFKTARSAEQFVVGAMSDKVGYGYEIEPGKQEVMDQVVEMLAAKRGVDVATIEAEITKKAHAKVKRDSRG